MWGSHCSGYDEEIFVFWGIILRSPLKLNRRFEGTCRLPLHAVCFSLISCLAYSTLNIEATCYSETSVDFQRTTRRYIPEERTLRNHSCENLKSYTWILFSGMWCHAVWKKLTDVFGEAYCLHLQHRKIRQTRNQQESNTKYLINFSQI
jgi:hypothetical protein